MTPAICPHCGYDLKQDEVIELDGFAIDPRGAVAFDGAPVQLRPTWYIILYTLAKAAPRLVSHAVLVARLDLKGLGAIVTLRGFVWELRGRLRLLGLPQPTRTARGLGYFWSLR